MKKLGIILVAVILAIFLFVFFKGSRFYQKVYKPGKNAPTLAPEKKDFNILFLGYGGEGHEGSYLTDTLILLHVDIKANKTLLISIPRDVWVSLPTRSGDEFESKINTLYQMQLYPDTFPDVDIPDGKNADTSLLASAVTHITGLPVDYYLGVDFDGFIEALDTLGGIDVNVQKAFTDPEYPLENHEDDLCGKDEDFKLIEPFLKPSEEATPEARPTLFKEKPELEEYLKNATESPYLAFPCRYETLSFKAGPQHMSGEQALKFARSRHSPEDGGDFARARRQQQVIEALKEKALSLSSAPKIVSLFDDLEKDIRTDIPPALVSKFALEVKDAKAYKISNLVLSDNDYLDASRSPNGQSILIPKAGADDWSEVKKWIKETLSSKIKNTPTP